MPTADARKGILYGMSPGTTVSDPLSPHMFGDGTCERTEFLTLGLHTHLTFAGLVSDHGASMIQILSHGVTLSHTYT